VQRQQRFSLPQSLLRALVADPALACSGHQNQRRWAEISDVTGGVVGCLKPAPRFNSGMISKGMPSSCGGAQVAAGGSQRYPHLYGDSNGPDDDKRPIGFLLSSPLCGLVYHLPLGFFTSSVHGRPGNTPLTTLQNISLIMLIYKLYLIFI
jgi:hypothetical protein